MKRIKILDSMRGLAASIVVFHHIYTRFYYLYAGNEKALHHRIFNFISNLNVEAVLFFFILSGFSIGLSLRKGLPVTKELFNEYAYRRLKRILPLYHVAIIFTVISGLLTTAIYTNPDFSFRNLLGNIFFLQCPSSFRGYWFAPYGDNGPLWSISFEMFYYFFFPFFIFVVLKLVKKPTLSTAINQAVICSSLLLSLVCLFINKYFFFPYIAFAAFFYTWYSGYFLSSLYINRQLRFNSSFILIILLAIVTGGLLYIQPAAGLYKLFAGSVIAVLFFVTYLIREKYRSIFIPSVERILNACFYHIGKGSYALYLLHYPLIMILKNYCHANLLEVLLSMFILIIFCSWLESYFVKLKWAFLQIRYIR